MSKTPHQTSLASGDIKSCQYIHVVDDYASREMSTMSDTEDKAFYPTFCGHTPFEMKSWALSTGHEEGEGWWWLDGSDMYPFGLFWKKHIRYDNFNCLMLKKFHIVFGANVHPFHEVTIRDDFVVF
jgi:hypothetical protein